MKTQHFKSSTSSAKVLLLDQKRCSAKISLVFSAVDVALLPLDLGGKGPYNVVPLFSLHLPSTILSSTTSSANPAGVYDSGDFTLSMLCNTRAAFTILEALCGFNFIFLPNILKIAHYPKRIFCYTAKTRKPIVKNSFFVI